VGLERENILSWQYFKKLRTVSYLLQQTEYLQLPTFFLVECAHSIEYNHYVSIQIPTNDFKRNPF
jgi:hypothetical protein